jgi:hypothetical protein
MPLFRYFTFVGGVLLALLVVMSSVFSEPETTTRPEAVRPVIRIASDRVGPARVDFDTRAQMAVVPASVPELASVPEIPQQAPVRIAERQLGTQPATPVLPAKIERRKTRIAKRPDRQRMAANPQGFQAFHLTW